MGLDASLIDGKIHFVSFGKRTQPFFLLILFLRGPHGILRQVVATQGDVLTGGGDRTTIAGSENIVRSQHQESGL